MAPRLLRIVGGGGSLPHPPCAAKRATAVASCTIFHRGSPAAASPGCWVLLGVGTQAVAGLAGFFQLRVALGGTHTCLTRRCRLLVPTVLPRGQPYRSVQHGRRPSHRGRPA